MDGLVRDFVSKIALSKACPPLAGAGGGQCLVDGINASFESM